MFTMPKYMTHRSNGQYLRGNSRYAHMAHGTNVMNNIKITREDRKGYSIVNRPVRPALRYASVSIPVTHNLMALYAFHFIVYQGSSKTCRKVAATSAFSRADV